MKVIMVEPGKEAYLKEIGNKLEDMQEAVNGLIQPIYPFRDPVAIILNDEGKLNGSRANRPFYNKEGNIANIFYGTFFICGVGKFDFTDIPDNLVEKYMAMFPIPGDKK